MEGDPIAVELAIGIGEKTAQSLFQLWRTTVQRTQEDTAFGGGGGRRYEEEEVVVVEVKEEEVGDELE